MSQASFDDAPCGYFAFTDQGLLLEVNSTLCTLLGYQKDDMIGKNIEFIFTLPTRIFYQTHFFPLLKLKGNAEEIFVTLLTREGIHLPVLLNAKRTVGANPVNSCAFIVVANRKKFEDELIAAKNAAEKSLLENHELKAIRSVLQEQTIHLDKQIEVVNKQNNELKQINHAATHTLKESVRKIYLNAQRMKEAENVPEFENYMDNLLNASVKIKSVISSLQQYIWLNEISTEYTEVDLNKLIENLTSQIKNNNNSVLNVTSEPLPVIFADSRQMALLFDALFSNAIKFRKGNKAEIIITSSLIRKNIYKHIQGKYNYHDYLKLQVNDSGLGFDPEFKDEVFGLFKKFHYGEGHGAGLAICKKIVENHQGTISAESKLNEFTKIEMILPINRILES